jgi:hypothetical protein
MCWRQHNHHHIVSLSTATSLMVSGQAPSPEIHKIVIQLSVIFTHDQIAAYTGVSISSVHTILNYFDEYQMIEMSKDKEEKRKKRAGDLRDDDIQVCCRRVKLVKLCERSGPLLFVYMVELVQDTLSLLFDTSPGDDSRAVEYYLSSSWTSLLKIKAYEEVRSPHPTPTAIMSSCVYFNNSTTTNLQATRIYADTLLGVHNEIVARHLVGAQELTRPCARLNECVSPTTILHLILIGQLPKFIWLTQGI